MAHGRDENDKPLSWPLVKARVDNRIEQILSAVDADSWEGFLTDSGSNFRLSEATIKPYKGNRSSPKPFHYHNIKMYLEGMPEITLVEGMEADDMLAIKQMERHSKDDYSTVICTRDKDLKMVPGNHYCWGSGNQSEVPLWFQSENGGWKWFFTQLLTGDSTDNIPGLYGVGQVKAEKLLQPPTEPLEMYIVCKNYYMRYFGSYWMKFMDENARLLWMKRTLEDDIRERFRFFDKKIEIIDCSKQDPLKAFLEWKRMKYEKETQVDV